MDSHDKKFIQMALQQARESVQQGGFPAGAVIVKDGEVVSQAISIPWQVNDPSAHGETAAIRLACKALNTSDLSGATLYESIECCVMCFCVAYWAGISKIVYAGRKTAEMAGKFYYEGVTDNETLNKENNRHIELVYASDFEQESLEIINQWEAQGGFDKK